MHFQGKVALVTGAAVGIGRAAALRFAEYGARLVLLDVQYEKLEALKEELGAYTADVLIYPCDISDEGRVNEVISDALHTFGKIDILVNNAALLVGDDDAVENVNFVSAQKLTILMAGREEGRASVVNILDAQVSPIESERTAKYDETKRALKDFTVKSAAMFASTLQVNAVAPGSVLVPVGVHEKAGETLLGRPKPEDVASAVEFLINARSITGVVLPVDGGMHILQ